jgi:hypothetical protein
MWHGLSHSCFYLSANFFFLILCTCFWVLGKKHGPLVFWELFFFFFLKILYMHLSLGQEAQSFQSFFFYLLAIFSFVLLYCVHAYQNQCYMCTKINVIQWLALSGRLVLRKISCNLDGVPIRHIVSKTTC